MMTTCDRSQSLVPDLPPDSQGSVGGEYAGHRKIEDQKIRNEAPSKPISICKQIRCIFVVNPFGHQVTFFEALGLGVRNGWCRDRACDPILDQASSCPKI